MAMKLRASMSGDTADIKCLMNHPMETGMRKDAASGKVVPAHYISNVTCTVGGKTVVDAQWGGGISKNPYLALKVKGAKSGDTVTVNWVDNKGEKESISANIA